MEELIKVTRAMSLCFACLFIGIGFNSVYVGVGMFLIVVALHK